MRVLLAPFYAMQQSKDPRYPTRDEYSTRTLRLGQRKANVEFKPAAVKLREHYRAQEPCKWSRSKTSELVKQCLWITV